MALAGEKVVWRGSETYSRRLLDSGVFYPGDAVLKRSYLRGCHGNAARNRDSKGWIVQVGYALRGGIWRQHSWNRDERGRLIETTVRHDAYYGISLTDRASERFVEQNLDSYP